MDIIILNMWGENMLRVMPLNTEDHVLIKTAEKVIKKKL